MGIYDREYYRGEAPQGVEFGGQRSMVINLLIINVVIYVLDLFTTDNWLMMNMAATPESLAHPWMWWQLLTYGFAHSPNDKWHIIANMFGLWMFGRDVEHVYGPREFLRIYLVTIILGGLVWATRACLTVDPAQWATYKMLGASGAVTAVILLFCVHFPKRTVLLMFVIPTPAWVLGVMIIVLNLLGMRSAGAHVAFDVHLVGAVFALAYWKLGWNLGRWTPRIPKPNKWLKSRPRLKVHDPEAAYDDLDRKANEILDKVNRNGLESLSPKEKRVLEDYSRRMRQKHR